MHPPLFVRTLSDDERAALRAGLRADDAFTVRRCQILLHSDQGLTAERIAANLGCSKGTARNAVRAFHAEGLACLKEKSTRPHSARPALTAEHAPALQELLHKSPRLYGHATSLWTLDLVAGICHDLGWTPRRLTGEAIRLALWRLGISWKRARRWLTSPDPAYARKKAARARLLRLADSHPDWVLGFQDETWWSRLAQPAVHTWAGAEPLHLLERTAAKGDPDPKALSCYGLLRADTGAMLLRFVQGRPVSQVTEDYLGWVCERLAAEGKKALLLVWDNASWHVSKRVREWIKAHNRRVKQEGGVRIVVCGLPVKAPWLNPIEPKWAHGKRAIVEPDRTLTAQEVKERVHDYYRCEQVEPLVQKVA